MLLVSVSEVKTFMEKTDTSHDALIGMIIEYVSAKIEIFLNRSLSKEYRTKTFDVKSKGKKYFLDSYPIDSSANITVTLDDTVETINEDYYVWFNEGVVEFDYQPTYIEPKQIVIDWLGGYETFTTTVSGVVKTELYSSELPDGIKFATLMQSAFVYRNRLQLGVQSISLPNGSLGNIFSGDLLPEVKDILKMYRKPAGGNI